MLTKAVFTHILLMNLTIFLINHLFQLNKMIVEQQLFNSKCILCLELPEISTERDFPTEGMFQTLTQSLLIRLENSHLGITFDHFLMFAGFFLFFLNPNFHTLVYIP